MFHKLDQVDSGDGTPRVRARWKGRKRVVFLDEGQLRQIIADLIRELKILMDRGNI